MSTLSIDNVKKVMFGNQKQSDGTNTVVASIIADHLFTRGFDLSSEEEAFKSIKIVLEHMIQDETVCNDLFIMLLLGIEAHTAIKNNLVILRYQQLTDSPKVYFWVELPDGTEYSLDKKPDESYPHIDCSDEFEKSTLEMLDENEKQMALANPESDLHKEIGNLFSATAESRKKAILQSTGSVYPAYFTHTTGAGKTMAINTMIQSAAADHITEKYRRTEALAERIMKCIPESDKDSLTGMKYFDALMYAEWYFNH